MNLSNLRIASSKMPVPPAPQRLDESFSWDSFWNYVADAWNSMSSGQTSGDLVERFWRWFQQTITGNYPEFDIWEGLPEWVNDPAKLQWWLENGMPLEPPLEQWQIRHVQSGPARPIGWDPTSHFMRPPTFPGYRPMQSWPNGWRLRGTPSGSPPNFKWTYEWVNGDQVIPAGNPPSWPPNGYNNYGYPNNPFFTPDDLGVGQGGGHVLPTDAPRPDVATPRPGYPFGQPIPGGNPIPAPRPGFGGGSTPGRGGGRGGGGGGFRPGRL